MKSVKYSLLIEVDGGEVVQTELGYECVSSLASRLDDSHENQSIFECMALSQSSEVRGEIATKSCISESTAELLADDPSIEVRRRLIGSTPFQEWASTELLLDYIKQDVECARSIAYNLESFLNAQVDKLAEEISAHSDPDVRNALAGNWRTPKKLLKKMLADADPGVRATAKRALD